MEKIFDAISTYIHIPAIGISDIIEILIIIFTLYKVISSVRNTRAWVLIKGILFLVIFYAISYLCKFNVILSAFNYLFSVLILVIVVIFQQDIKKILEGIGKKEITIQSLISKITRKDEDDSGKVISDENIDSIVNAVEAMSKVKTGALILIEREIPLNDYHETGTIVDAAISEQMLVQIFEKNTPLHDGAVIINNNRIQSATCYLPLTDSTKVSKKLGTRHRAGIGVSEVSDCLVIIVSEETGKISTVLNGKLKHGIGIDSLKSQLKNIQINENKIKNVKTFKKNPHEKLIAMFLGIMVWFLAINSIDPVISKEISGVKINVQNEESIKEQSLTYELKEGTKTTVIVKGKRSVIDGLSANDINAYINLDELSITNTVEVNTDVKNTLLDVDVEPEDKYIKVIIEEMAEADYPIEIEKIGTLKTDNHINSISLSTSSIMIAGAESKISTIGEVKVIVDITNTYNGAKQKLVPIIYDKNGDEMDSNLFVLNVNEIEATINMSQTKTVPFTLIVEDAEGNNGEIIQYDYEKTNIKIAANEDVLSSVEEITINVPIEIGHDTKESNFIKVINIDDYLPEGYNLAEADNKLIVNLSYEPYVEKMVLINPEDIEIIDKKTKKYDYLVSGSELFVKIKGLKTNINSITSSDLNASIIATDLAEGSHVIKINCEETEKYTVVDSSNATLTIVSLNKK